MYFTGELLHDVKEDGAKPIDWKRRKQVSLRLAHAYKRIGSPKAGRMFECGGYLEFKRFHADDSMRLNTGSFCQVRLCPLCSWRRSRKMFAQVSKIMAEMVDYEYILLTLTCENVEGPELNSQIDIMYKAFKLLCLRKRFKSAVHGWIRSFEVTYNWAKRDYHPHFHCVLAVKQEYFTSNIYMDHDDWCELWQSCMNANYDIVVDVRKLKESEKGAGKEVAEVAKYSVKPSSVIVDMRGMKEFTQEIQENAKKLSDSTTDEVVATLDSALHNRRLNGFGGIFKAKHRELNLNNDDTDLVHAGDSEEPKDDDYTIEKYCWNIEHKNFFRYIPKVEDDTVF